jgi:hypothetical protein
VQIETFARKNPALVIFDDAHWADPTSLEIFGRVGPLTWLREMCAENATPLSRPLTAGS